MDKAQFETVWSGNTWRTYPAPAIATPTYYGKAERANQAGAALTRHSAREMVFAVLSNGGWHSVLGTMARTGLSDRRVRFVLTTAAKDGILERMTGVPTRKQCPTPMFLYRRTNGAT